MADEAPSFESQDIEGSSDHFNGTVGTTAVPIPTVAGDPIHEFLIESREGNSAKKLFVSFDGGTLFKTVDGGGNMSWAPKGRVTQIHIKASAANHNYEIIMNRGNA